ncbi:MAG: UDP-forming cellulose synthase catalytic subunit [Candidatus Kuenenia sp.]|nr:UDP-forming cellulose synthase catalytic subunit [Candidatus Kuenenia hertensis]
MITIENLRKIHTRKLDSERFIFLLMCILASIGAFCFIYMAGFYLEIFRQIWIFWGLVVFIIIANKIEVFKRPPLRILFILIIVFITLRYLHWRTFQSLVYTGPIDFAATILLYGAEAYAVAIHFFGLFVNVWPLNHKIAPLPADPRLYPTVDIFIPTYSEPEDVIRTTAISCTQIDYPKDKFNVYILDDGGTVAKRNHPEKGMEAWNRYYSLKRMAKELGVRYITRQQNIHAKAGNLNHALQHTNAELVLVLDCDHVPTRDILRNTAGWFLKDEKLFLVQTPHFFINPDPFEKNLAIFGDAPGENEMFYHSIHHGLDFWNATYFCGSAAVLRRKYLMEVGGIAGETITEDAETTVALHKKGYNSVYIDRPMVCGLSPESFDDLLLQRSRWAQGMIQIFILKNPLFAKGMKLYQRFCYLSSSLFWFFGFSRFIFYIVPAAFLLFGLKVYHASFLEIMAYALPHVVGCVIVTDFLHGKFRWPFFSEIYESVLSIFLLPVIYSVIRNPRKPTFKVTPKGTSLEETVLTRQAIPFLLMVITIVACVPMAIIKWIQYPLFRDIILITLSWTVFNLFIAMASLGAFVERRQIRRHHRMWARGKVNVYFPRMRYVAQGGIMDISYSGMGVELKTPFQIKQEEDVVLNVRDIYGEKYEFEARIFRQIKKKEEVFCGCDFVTKDKATKLRLIKYVYGDSQRWEDFLQKRFKRASPWVIFYFLIRMGTKGSKDCVVLSSKLLYSTLKKAFFVMYRGMQSLWLKTAKGDVTLDG